MKNMKKIWSMVVMIVMIAALFTGCGGPETPDDGPVVPDGGEQVQPDGGDVSENGGTQTEENAVTVNSIEGLLEAIAPNTVITIEPGYYILSEFMDELWAEEGEMWNVNHQYVQIREGYDGLELLVQNVDNLSIIGGAEDFADTEIVTEPRYATVLNFYQCSDVELGGFTIGHTDYVSCEGNVLDFYACNDVNLYNMDIYGCGLYGIGAMKNCGNISVSDSIIRDCSDGPLWLVGGTGTYEFTNCSFTGSWGGGGYYASDDSALRFVNCEFGESESNKWYFNEEAEFVDCVWSEITQYPDYGG